MPPRLARQVGQDRLDLALGNARIVASSSRQIGEHAPDATLLMVTNPVDVMTSVALRYSGLDPSRVFGLGTHLDSMRLKSLIASFFKVHVSEVYPDNRRTWREHGPPVVSLPLSEAYRSATCRHSPGSRSPKWSRR